jgi:mono/diheme cytochrome c family protein
MLRKIFLGVAVALVLITVAGAGFVAYQASAFDRSTARVYEVAPLNVRASSDPAVIARGRHLVAVGGCGVCHGADLGGKPGDDMGPLGSMPGSNITPGKGGVGGRYSDVQLANVIRHGIKASGKSLLFMPSQDMSWWPDDDLTALVSYLRTVPPVDRSMPAGHIGVVGKVLDRVGVIPLDAARRIDHHAAVQRSLPPTATAEYGAKLARTCVGCHGEHFSGGQIPGAP